MYISLGILGILLVTMVLGVFSEMVVMAIGGMALYAFGMSEPKFPMTKRAMVTGIIVGTIITFLGVYLNLKLGVVYFIGAEMLGARHRIGHVQVVRADAVLEQLLHQLLHDLRIVVDPLQQDRLRAQRATGVG